MQILLSKTKYCLERNYCWPR